MIAENKNRDCKRRLKKANKRRLARRIAAINEHYSAEENRLRERIWAVEKIAAVDTNTIRGRAEATRKARYYCPNAIRPLRRRRKAAGLPPSDRKRKQRAKDRHIKDEEGRLFRYFKRLSILEKNHGALEYIASLFCEWLNDDSQYVRENGATAFDCLASQFVEYWECVREESRRMATFLHALLRDPADFYPPSETDPYQAYVWLYGIWDEWNAWAFFRDFCTMPQLRRCEHLPSCFLSDNWSRPKISRWFAGPDDRSKQHFRMDERERLNGKYLEILEKIVGQLAPQ